MSPPASPLRRHGVVAETPPMHDPTFSRRPRTFTPDLRLLVRGFCGSGGGGPPTPALTQLFPLGGMVLPSPGLGSSGPSTNALENLGGSPDLDGGGGGHAADYTSRAVARADHVAAMSALFYPAHIDPYSGIAFDSAQTGGHIATEFGGTSLLSSPEPGARELARYVVGQGSMSLYATHRQDVAAMARLTSQELLHCRPAMQDVEEYVVDDNEEPERSPSSSAAETSPLDVAEPQEEPRQMSRSHAKQFSAKRKDDDNRVSLDDNHENDEDEEEDDDDDDEDNSDDCGQVEYDVGDENVDDNDDSDGKVDGVARLATGSSNLEVKGSRTASGRPSRSSKKRRRLAMERAGCSAVQAKLNRAAAIQRLRAKKALRSYEYRVRYDCRKKIALVRPRINGRFATKDEVAEAKRLGITLG
jgi:CCT motif